MSLVHKAIREHQSIEVIKTICWNYPDERLKREPVTQMTLMQHAAAEGRVDIILWLLTSPDLQNGKCVVLDEAQDVSPKYHGAKDEKSEHRIAFAAKPPLALAFENGHWLAAQVLLALGADKEKAQQQCRDRGLADLSIDPEVFCGLLHRAVMWKSNDLLKLLIQQIDYGDFSSAQKLQSSDSKLDSKHAVCSKDDKKNDKVTAPLLERSSPQMRVVIYGQQNKVAFSFLQQDLPELLKLWPDNALLQDVNRRVSKKDEKESLTSNGQKLSAEQQQIFYNDVNLFRQQRKLYPMLQYAMENKRRGLLLRVALIFDIPLHKLMLELINEAEKPLNMEGIKVLLEKFYNITSGNYADLTKKGVLYSIVSQGIAHHVTEVIDAATIKSRQNYLRIMGFSKSPEQFIVVFFQVLQKSPLLPLKLKQALRSMPPQVQTPGNVRKWFVNNNLFNKTIYRVLNNYAKRFGIDIFSKKAKKNLGLLSASHYQFALAAPEIRHYICDFLQPKEQVRWAVATHGESVVPYGKVLLIDQFLGAANFYIVKQSGMRMWHRLKTTTWRDRLCAAGIAAVTTITAVSAKQVSDGQLLWWSGLGSGLFLYGFSALSVINAARCHGRLAPPLVWILNRVRTVFIDDPSNRLVIDVPELLFLFVRILKEVQDLEMDITVRDIITQLELVRGGLTQEVNLNSKESSIDNNNEMVSCGGGKEQKDPAAASSAQSASSSSSNNSSSSSSSVAAATSPLPHSVLIASVGFLSGSSKDMPLQVSAGVASAFGVAKAPAP